MSDDDKNLWDRREDETSHNYKAFCIYRDLGSGRTLRKCSQEISSYSYVRKWCGEYNWVARCEAYDDHLEQIRRQEREQALKDAQQQLSQNLLDLMNTSIEGALDGDIHSAQVTMLRDLMDRAGLQIIEKHQHDIDVMDADTLASILGITQEGEDPEDDSE